ncbi:hypothetical protein VH571_10325 [Frondihabitans sp. 4ASC-45]|uniref:hypothetical protein n=1 Tax=Frondihabitans sp. 4ASC-45 TaxID=3111636 RepID=UPI003C20B56B
MTLSKGFVTTSGSTALDARLVEQALLVKNANDVPRVGVLYGAINPLMTTNSMTLIVTDQVVFAVSRGNSDGAVLVTVSGAYTVTIAGAPASNSRIDVIYIKQNDTDQGDANSNPVIGVVQGDASASPRPNALPTGAVQIATLTIPARAISTSSTGVILTHTIGGTALHGQPIRYRNLTAMNADAANVIDGTLGYVKGGDLYWMQAGSWQQFTGDTGWVGFSPASGFTATSNLAYRRIGQTVYLRGQIQPNSGNIVASTLATLPGGIAPAQNTAYQANGSGTVTSKVLINTDGTIVTGTPTAATPYLRLDGMIFPTL